MAGALNEIAQADIVPAIMPQVGAFPGVDRNLLTLMQTPPGPESPYARRLHETSQALIGEPEEIAGALQSSRRRYDDAVRGKMTAIGRAMDTLSGANRRPENLPALAAAAALLQPTGSIGESIGRAFSATGDKIEQQRAIERQVAGALGRYGIDQADAEMEGAKGDEGFLQKRVSMAQQMENQAGTVQNRSDLNAQRGRQNVLQYAARIGAAELSKDRNRWQFIGNDPKDQTVGVYLDKTTGQKVMGPAAGARGAAEWRYNAWLAAHPNDTAGALDYAAGRRRMSPEQVRASAVSMATRQLGIGADSEEVDERAKEIAESIMGGFEGEEEAMATPAQVPPPAARPQPQPRPAPAGGRGGGRGGPPPAPAKQPPAGFRKAPDGFFYAPDPQRPGKYLKWTG